MTALIDTCVAIWLLEGPRQRLTAAAQTALASGPVGVPAVVLLEVGYLVQRNRLRPEALDHLHLELDLSGNVLVPVALGLDAFRHAADIPRAVSTDPFDRMVAGTAMALDLPLITADRKLQAVPGLNVIW